MEKKLFLTAILLVFTIFLIGTIFVIAGSFNPDDERLIGYEFLDLEGNITSPAQGEVVHIWNNATISDYFFNKSSGIQLTNHYEDYWSRNIFCLGYYDGEEWNKIKCADELSNFNRDIQTDNSTYVNATLWKDFAYETYNFRLGVQYYLGLNDKTLSVTIYGKNIGIDIPFDLGFAWKIVDVDIPSSYPDDDIQINGTAYLLDGTFDLLFKDMEKASFKVRNDCRYLRIDWDKNLSYAVKMHGDGNQEDFYIALLVDAGHFNPGQEKTTTFQWVDAGECDGEVYCDDIDDEGFCYECGCDWELGMCFGNPPCSGTEFSCEDCPDCTWLPAGPDSFYINVADTWRLTTGVYINVADSWRDVEVVRINIADSWRTVFSI